MSLTVLLVEDDPASREFVGSTLASAARVEAVRSLAEAGSRCAETTFDLMVVDVSLPDGEGDAWLARQRALGNRTPAVALTAELDGDRRRRLMACGFADALGKPITAPALRTALRPWLGDRGWDDGRALAALGGAEDTLARMRALFLAELPTQRGRLEAALGRSDEAAARAVLHQLKAGCAFVGARALADAVDALHREPLSGPHATAVYERMDEALAGRG